MSRARDLANRTIASAALPKAGGAMTGAITTNSTFDGIDVATAVAANTAKTGITSEQASAITANTAKVTNYNQTLSDINALDVTELGTVTSANLANTAIVYPAGHVLQDKIFKSGSESNTLDNTYTNYYEVSIVLKSATSHVNLEVSSCYRSSATDCGGGVKIYRHTASSVTNSHTEVSGLIQHDGTGPHDLLYYFGSTMMMWHRFMVPAVDTFSNITQTKGQTIYYAALARQYNTTYGTGIVPSGANSEWTLRVTEIQQ